MSLYNKIIDLQKLGFAWERVKKNKPAAGADNITAEEFDKNKREELKRLEMELRNHSYEVIPVRQVTIYKGEKARVIALYAMRDKVVQQSIAAELNQKYEQRFSGITYAYRSNMSALEAIRRIEEGVHTGKYHYFLKVDISKYFDNICWEQLKNVLAKDIVEEDVLDLIHKNACTRILEDDGELKEKTNGIHQGSGISPVLSNIYLLDFDHWLEDMPVQCFRYSDDLLVLGPSDAELRLLLSQIRQKLEALGLQLNEKKTYIRTMEEGVNFLGYHLDKNGKAIPASAESNLAERLETMWLTETSLTTEEKLKKSREILGGWEQYFRGERIPGSIYEYVTLLHTDEIGQKEQEELWNIRPEFQNTCRDIAELLLDLWFRNGKSELELLEYEQFYGLETDIKLKYRNDYQIQQLLHLYRELFPSETEELALELMQCYTDLTEYENAKHWQEWINIRKASTPEFVTKKNIDENSQPFEVQKSIVSRILQIFSGREDIYSEETLGPNHSRHSEICLQPLTEKVVEAHLRGDQTIGTCVQRPNGTARYFVIDVDVSRKVLLQYDRGSEQFQGYLSRALKKCGEIMKYLRSRSIPSYLEYSGNRGYHIWILFEGWVPVRFLNMLEDILQKEINADDDITIEFFPNKTRIRDGKYGQVIKLPLGIHVRTGDRSCFLDESGQPVNNIEAFCDSLSKVSIGTLKRVLATTQPEEINSKKRKTQHSPAGDNTVKYEFHPEAYGELPDTVSEVLLKCRIMQYLCDKALKTGYLSHFERLSVLYVFGHLGQDGKDFVHQIMSSTMNYQFHVTEKFIRKLPEKPISCIKLREQYRQISAELGCNCVFKHSKGCYPSPVLHAISTGKDIESGITVPISKTLTKEKELKVIEEMNIHKRAQEIAARILELKKQRRGIDSAVRKAEKELEKIFDAENIEALELEMGLLVRRKKDSGYEWLIEI